VVAKIGYARASSVDQSLDTQRRALQDAGCAVIREEKRSGTTREGRDELATTLEFLREGDELMVTRIDRLARSVSDLANIVNELRAKGASLRAIEQNIETKTASGNAFLQMLAVFAEFETAIRRERQMAGIEAARAKGVYKGRSAVIDRAEVIRLKAEGFGPVQIARRLGIGRASVYRIFLEQTTPKSVPGQV
jgi:DNA invertase Pin-like site-specific DNA recombinase